MTHVICDVIGCGKIASGVCEICENPICLLHATIQKTIYTNNNSTAIDRAGYCPDCNYAAYIEIGTGRYKLCCIEYGRIFIVISLLFILTTVIIVAATKGDVLSAFGLPLVLLLVILVCYFGGKSKVKNHNATVESLSRYKKIMKKSNGLHNSNFNVKVIKVEEVPKCDKLKLRPAQKPDDYQNLENK